MSADQFNETIFRADSLATEQEVGDDDSMPVRASIQMKKPSIDFNAIAPNFLNKISTADVSEQKSTAKAKGKMFWGLATSLKNMVTRRLNKS